MLLGRKLITIKMTNHMKTNIFTSAIASICFLTLAFSCNDNQLSVSDTDMGIKTEQLVTENKGIIYPLSMEFKNSLTKSTGNEFETNWENLQEITLSEEKSISLPWRENSQESIPFDIARDIKKEDGWKMLLHTLTESVIDIDKYIVLYNQRTGIMKVFYFSEANIPNNTAKWTLKFINDQTWLNMGVDVAIPINLGMLKSWTCTNAIQGNAKGIVKGWNCFQIALAYNPNNTSVQYMELLCESENTTNYNFFGTSYAYSNGTILTYGSTQSSTPINLNVGTIIGGDAENYITNNVVNKTRGISLDVIKKAAKIVGKLTGLINKKPSVIKSDLEITTRGNFEVTGTSTILSSNTSLRVPFTENKVGKVGSWNLREQPTVYLNPLADYDPNVPVSVLGERAYHLRGITKCDYDLVINPDLQSHIKKQWVEIDFVKYWLKSAYSGDVDYQKYLKEKEAFIPQSPDCYKDFGSLGTNGTGFQMTYYESDVLSGSYTGGKGIFDFDFSNQRFTVRSSYQDLIGHDANVVFVPNAQTYEIAKINYENLFMRVSLYTVTEFEGKEETTISTRTFLPKYEWDPDMYNEYKNLYPKMSSINSSEPAKDKPNTRPAALYIDEQHPEGLIMENYK